jgi:hypothetical protein
MRLRNLALTVLFGLGVCGFVSAEESGNWFTRMFSRSAEKTESGESAKVESAKSAPKSALPDNRIIKAQADLQRRQDVCERLMKLAIDSGDDELFRKAEALDQRAYEAYKATVGPRIRQEPIGTVKMNDLRAAEKNAKGGR